MTNLINILLICYEVSTAEQIRLLQKNFVHNGKHFRLNVSQVVNSDQISSDLVFLYYSN